MIILAVLFGLISMMGYGFANAYAKPLSQKFNISQLIYLRGCVLVTIMGLLAVPSWHNLTHWEVALATIGLGVLGYIPVLAFTNAIKISPLGIVAPITGTSTLVTILLSVLFLHVVLNPGQWIAAMVIIAANMVLSADIGSWKRPNFLNVSSGVRLALMATFGFGLFYFFLIPATKVLGPWLSAFLLELGITIAAIMHIQLSLPKASLQKVTRSMSLAVVTNAILLGLGTLAFTVGVKHFNAGIVTVLSNSSALVTTFIGIYLFREELHFKDKVAAVVVILGIGAMSVL
ncbi:MAG TPA: DMT family transporter [Candidatus Saccharimonadales bacterium]